MKPVWVVDDDRSIRWVLEKTLAREGVAFKSFASATEALAQLDHGGEPPQVLLSDIRMPGQSGLELLQEVKTRFPAVPVIIMTAYSDLESAVAAFQGGAFEYLPKPFDVDQAVELDPASGETRFLRGQGHLALRHLPQAISDLQAASQRLPDRADIYYQLALSLEAAHQTADAIRAAENALRLVPDFTAARDLSQRLRR